MTECPHCHKHLLSQASARCSWCGEAIEDAAYQANAKARREEFYAHTAAHDAQSLAAIEAIATGGMPTDPLTPLLGTNQARVRQQQMAREQASAAELVQSKADAPADAVPADTVQDNTEQRFQHLEI